MQYKFQPVDKWVGKIQGVRSSGILHYVSG